MMKFLLVLIFCFFLVTVNSSHAEEEDCVEEVAMRSPEEVAIEMQFARLKRAREHLASVTRQLEQSRLDLNINTRPVYFPDPRGSGRAQARARAVVNQAREAVPRLEAEKSNLEQEVSRLAAELE